MIHAARENRPKPAPDRDPGVDGKFQRHGDRFHSEPPITPAGCTIRVRDLSDLCGEMP
jgi:hypothetical protein